MKAMKHRLLTILAISVSLFCIAANAYWFVHRDIHPGTFIRINLTTALVFILIVFLPAVERRLKK